MTTHALRRRPGEIRVSFHVVYLPGHDRFVHVGADPDDINPWVVSAAPERDDRVRRFTEEEARAWVRARGTFCRIRKTSGPERSK